MKLSKPMQAFFCAALCLFLLNNLLENLQKSRERRDWIQTTATVTDVTAIRVRSGRRGHRTVYDMTYVYEVGGRTYTGTIYHAKTRHVVGWELPIKYDPDGPHSSTAELKLSTLDWLAPLVLAAAVGAVAVRESGLPGWLRRKRR